MYDIMFQGMPGCNSGYGNAILFFALSFYKSGLNVCFDFAPKDHYESKVKEEVERAYPEFKDFIFSKNAKVCFFVGTPKVPERLDIYNILYFYWETDSLPKSWIKKINYYEEIWVPCKLMKKALIKINYRGIIKVFPTPNIKKTKFSKFVIGHQYNPHKVISDEIFKFYYIFQWQYRKGYDCLIKAYYRAFNKGEKVLLILKTNKLSGSNEDFISKMKKEISIIKNNRQNLPSIYIIPEIISDEQLVYLHKSCDVYVAPHRGEGWGMPIVDAINQNSLVITTNFGGVSEYLDEDSAIMIDYNKVNVKNMNWSGPLYSSNQKWAEPNIESLSNSMKDSYYNFNKYKNKTESAYNKINNFEVSKLSKIIKKEFQINRFKK